MIRIAEEAGKRLLAFHGRIDRSAVEYKGPVDLVTEADVSTEQFIRDSLERSFPGVAILGEEISPRAGLEGEVWLVDPLDGTTNFVHGHPVFAVSIALATDGLVRAGVIHAPVLRETYSALRGTGACLGSRRIAVSDVRDFPHALMATGFAALRRPGGVDNLAHFAHVVKRVEGVRRAGAATMDLAFVAAGRLDGFWEFNLSPWDVAAGSLMVEEAGGKVTDLEGGSSFLRGPAIVAANAHLHERLLTELQRC